MKRRRSKGSSGLFDEIIIDNFAGGGGASLGIERALGRAVDLAVNHDRNSIEMHTANHPHTRHLCQNVWNVDIKKEVGRKPVGLGWFSPDCTHFSRAKGGKPVKKEIRGLAWIVIKQAKLVRPRVIILENVREFEEWGPLVHAKGPDGKLLYTENREPVLMPCKDRKGQTFKRWLRELRKLGYKPEWRQLNAADYGAPTHRRRLFLIARCDGRPIIWPEPTHGPPDVQWAADYFICSWMARSACAGTKGEFSGDICTRWDAGGGDSATRFHNAAQGLHAWQRIMQRCTFELLDVFEFIKRMMKTVENLVEKAAQKGEPHIVEHAVYIDPPFWGPGRSYKFTFTLEQHRQLARVLTHDVSHTRIVCRFYDIPLLRELYPEGEWTYRHLEGGRKQTNDEAPEVLLIRGPRGGEACL